MQYFISQHNIEHLSLEQACSFHIKTYKEFLIQNALVSSCFVEVNLDLVHAEDVTAQNSFIDCSSLENTTQGTDIAEINKVDALSCFHSIIAFLSSLRSKGHNLANTPQLLSAEERALAFFQEVEPKFTKLLPKFVYKIQFIEEKFSFFLDSQADFLRYLDFIVFLSQLEGSAKRYFDYITSPCHCSLVFKQKALKHSQTSSAVSQHSKAFQQELLKKTEQSKNIAQDFEQDSVQDRVQDCVHNCVQDLWPSTIYAEIEESLNKLEMFLAPCPCRELAQVNTHTNLQNSLSKEAERFRLEPSFLALVTFVLPFARQNTQDLFVAFSEPEHLDILQNRLAIFERNNTSSVSTVKLLDFIVANIRQQVSDLVFLQNVKAVHLLDLSVFNKLKDTIKKHSKTHNASDLTCLKFQELHDKRSELFSFINEGLSCFFQLTNPIFIKDFAQQNVGNNTNKQDLNSFAVQEQLINQEEQSDLKLHKVEVPEPKESCIVFHEDLYQAITTSTNLSVAKSKTTLNFTCLDSLACAYEDSAIDCYLNDKAIISLLALTQHLKQSPYKSLMCSLILCNTFSCTNFLEQQSIELLKAVQQATKACTKSSAIYPSICLPIMLKLDSDLAKKQIDSDNHNSPQENSKYFVEFYHLCYAPRFFIPVFQQKLQQQGFQLLANEVLSFN